MSEAPPRFDPQEEDSGAADPDYPIARDSPLSDELYDLLSLADLETPLPRHPRKPSSTPEGTLGRDTEPVDYYEYQHATWRRLLGLQTHLTRGRCASEYARGRTELEGFSGEIPTLRELDRWLESRSDWRIVRADGYVQPRAFFAMLAANRFPCMDQIRHENETLYSAAPDMYHDIVGHLPMLQDKRFSEYYATFGRAGSNARHEEHIEALNRIYWYTMEFGLIERDEEALPYGAGIVTALGELLVSRGSSVTRKPFEMGEVIASPTEISRPNSTLFVIDEFETLLGSFVEWARSEKLL